MNKNEKKHLGALDVFIIILLVACLVSVGIRIFSTMNSDTGSHAQLDNYIVSFKILNIKDSSAKNYFEKGTKFYLKDSEEFFGTLREGVTIKDAESYYQMHDGTVVLSTNNANGDLYRVDVEASLDVQGMTDANGVFLLDGNKYLAPNKEVLIYSKYLSVNVKIMDIKKAQ